MPGKALLKRLSILSVAVVISVMFWSSNVAFSDEFVVEGVPSEVPPPRIQEVPSVDAEVAPADATTINFDDVSAPCSFIDTVALRNQYSHLGITFEGPGPRDGGAILDECTDFDVTGYSAPNFLAFNPKTHLSDGGIPKTPEKIRFWPPASSVTVKGGNGITTGKTVTMKAYASDDSLLGTDSIITQPALQTMSITAIGIAYVVVDCDYPFVLDDLTFVQITIRIWSTVYDRISKRTGTEGILPAARLYRDKVLMSDPTSAKLVVDLYENCSDDLARVLLHRSVLARRAAVLAKKYLPGLGKAVDGSQLLMTSAELAEVNALLDDIGEAGSRELQAYIQRVQRLLKDQKALASLGIKVSGRRMMRAPGLKKGNLTATWGAIKESVEDR